jgi:hypothetical protein
MSGGDDEKVRPFEEEILTPLMCFLRCGLPGDCGARLALRRLPRGLFYRELCELPRCAASTVSCLLRGRLA